VLARQAAAAVGVETCWPWETAATLPSPRRRKALRRSPGEERGGAYRGGCPPTACSMCMYFMFFVSVFYILRVNGLRLTSYLINEYVVLKDEFQK